SKKPAFWVGFVLASANPLSLIFWISLSGAFLKESQSLYVTTLLILGVVFGALFLFFLLILALRAVKKSLNAVHMKYMSVLFGFIITGYGVLTILKIFS